jgi:hypothetical protein
VKDHETLFQKGRTRVKTHFCFPSGNVVLTFFFFFFFFFFCGARGALRRSHRSSSSVYYPLPFKNSSVSQRKAQGCLPWERQMAAGDWAVLCYDSHVHQTAAAKSYFSSVEFFGTPCPVLAL